MATRRHLLFYYAGFFGGALLRRMLVYAMVVYGFEVLGSGHWSGVFYFVLLLPYLVFSLPAGRWIDRLSPGRVLRIAVGLAAPLLGLLFLAMQFGPGALGNGHGVVLLALVTMYGSAYAVAYPAYLAALPALVPSGEVPRASVRLNTLAVVCMAYAPFVVGWLREGLAWPELFAAMAGLAVLAWLALLAARVPRPLPSVQPEGTEVSGQGLYRYCRDHAPLRAWLWVALAFNGLMVGPLEVLLPLFAEGTLALGPLAAGGLIGIGGTGLIVGAIVALRLLGRGRLGPWLCAAALGGAVAIIAMTWGPSAWVRPTLFLGGMMGGMVSSLSLAGVQATVSDAMRGRVLGLLSLILGGVPALGGVLAGGVAEIVGVVPALRLSFGLGALAFGLLWILQPALRQPPPPRPET